MPYVNLKLYPGRSEEQKREAARRIREVVTEVCKVAPGADFPVVIEEVAPENWNATIDPELQAKAAHRYDP
jgi:4-oxalocrotonate tautomerase family enzyme